MEAVPLVLVVASVTLAVWALGVVIYCLPLLRNGYRPWAPRGADRNDPFVGHPARVVAARVLRGWPVTPLPREPLAISEASIAGPGRRPSVFVDRNEVEAVVCVRWHPQGNFLLFRSEDSRYRNIAVAPSDFDAGLQLLQQLGWPTSDRRRPRS